MSSQQHCSIAYRDSVKHSIKFKNSFEIEIIIALNIQIWVIDGKQMRRLRIYGSL